MTGQGDTRPWSRCSSLSDALPESCHMCRPSIEACLPCDLHQGFCSLVYSVVVRPRREMGDTSCLQRKCGVPVCFLFHCIFEVCHQEVCFFFFFSLKRNQKRPPEGVTDPTSAFARALSCLYCIASLPSCPLCSGSDFSIRVILDRTESYSEAFV